MWKVNNYKGEQVWYSEEEYNKLKEFYENKLKLNEIIFMQIERKCDKEIERFKDSYVMMSDFGKSIKNIIKGNFINDRDKMQDFLSLTKEEFLQSYSYITAEEYDNTYELYKLLYGE